MEKENQLVIDLGSVTLTSRELKALQKAIHKTVAKKIQKAKGSAPGAESTERAATTSRSVPDRGTTAELQVTFSDVEPGLSGLTATHNNENPQTLDQSGTLRFTGVKKRDLIDSNGFGAGSKTVSISGVVAVPMQMNFAPGQHINGSFLIIG